MGDRLRDYGFMSPFRGNHLSGDNINQWLIDTATYNKILQDFGVTSTVEFKQPDGSWGTTAPTAPSQQLAVIPRMGGGSEYSADRSRINQGGQNTTVTMPEYRWRMTGDVAGANAALVAAGLQRSTTNARGIQVIDGAYIPTIVDGTKVTTSRTMAGPGGNYFIPSNDPLGVPGNGSTTATDRDGSSWGNSYARTYGATNPSGTNIGIQNPTYYVSPGAGLPWTNSNLVIQGAYPTTSAETLNIARTVFSDPDFGLLIRQPDAMRLIFTADPTLTTNIQNRIYDIAAQYRRMDDTGGALGVIGRGLSGVMQFASMASGLYGLTSGLAGLVGGLNPIQAIIRGFNSAGNLGNLANEAMRGANTHIVGGGALTPAQEVVVRAIIGAAEGGPAGALLGGASGILQKAISHAGGITAFARDPASALSTVINNPNTFISQLPRPDLPLNLDNATPPTTGGGGGGGSSSLEQAINDAITPPSLVDNLPPSSGGGALSGAINDALNPTFPGLDSVGGLLNGGITGGGGSTTGGGGSLTGGTAGAGGGTGGGAIGGGATGGTGAGYVPGTGGGVPSIPSGSIGEEQGVPSWLRQLDQAATAETDPALKQRLIAEVNQYASDFGLPSNWRTLPTTTTGGLIGSIPGQDIIGGTGAGMPGTGVGSVFNKDVIPDNLEFNFSSNFLNSALDAGSQLVIDTLLPGLLSTGTGAGGTTPGDITAGTGGTGAAGGGTGTTPYPDSGTTPGIGTGGVTGTTPTTGDGAQMPSEIMTDAEWQAIINSTNPPQDAAPQYLSETIPQNLRPYYEMTDLEFFNRLATPENLALAQSMRPDAESFMRDLYATPQQTGTTQPTQPTQPYPQAPVYGSQEWLNQQIQNAMTSGSSGMPGMPTPTSSWANQIGEVQDFYSPTGGVPGTGTLPGAGVGTALGDGMGSGIGTGTGTGTGTGIGSGTGEGTGSGTGAGIGTGLETLFPQMQGLLETGFQPGTGAEFPTFDPVGSILGGVKTNFPKTPQRKKRGIRVNISGRARNA